ncbi:MAG: hypothetical protein K0U84_24600, partial [Actinomycetia bacterium]|nr:hypothetical protein [Actinomycetes bacterium]
MTIQSDAEIIDTDASVSRKAKAAAQSSPVGAQPYDVPLPMDFPPEPDDFEAPPEQDSEPPAEREKGRTRSRVKAKIDVGNASADDPPGRPLNATHRDYLIGEGISAAFVDERATANLLRSVEPGDALPEGFGWLPLDARPGILFCWDTGKQQSWQLRPDTPPLDARARPRKYLFAHGAGASFAHVHRTSWGLHSHTILVEGTKQSLAVASAITAARSDNSPLPDADVVAIPGVRGWSKGGTISPALAAMCRDRAVIVIADGDAATNRNVYTALEDLGASLGAAKSVRYAWLPHAADARQGIDDILATIAPEDRRTTLEDFILGAQPKPARKKPHAKSGATPGEFDPWDSEGKLRVSDISDHLISLHHWILTEESEELAAYRQGVYRIDPRGRQLKMDLKRLLGNSYLPSHLTAIRDMIEGTLENAPRLPVFPPQQYANFRNGLVDLRTGELLPHTPKFPCLRQFPFDYDPHSDSDRWVTWGIGQFGAQQFAAIEECAGQMFDASRVPGKMMIPFGPSRTGKSTIGRILRRIAGARYTSAVQLHQLDAGGGGDKYQSAKLYGKTLNIAPDLPASHVEDLSIIKSLTEGEDIPANRKYGPAFDFAPTALMVFCTNTIPTTGEQSGAWFDRVTPIAAVRSFIGRSNRAIESAIIEQLPGVITRLIRAYGEHLRREDELARLTEEGVTGDDLPDIWLPLPESVWERFRGDSDRVLRFLSGCCRILDPKASLVKIGTVGLGSNGPSTPAELHNAFLEWADQQKMGSMGRKRFIDKLRTVPGVVDVRTGPDRVRALSIEILDPGDWDAKTPTDATLLAALFGEGAPAAEAPAENLLGVEPLDDPIEIDEDDPAQVPPDREMTPEEEAAADARTRREFIGDSPLADISPRTETLPLLERVWELVQASTKPASITLRQALCQVESGELKPYAAAKLLARVQAVPPQLTVSAAAERLDIAPEAALPLLRVVALNLKEKGSGVMMREVTRMRGPDGRLTVLDPLAYIAPEDKAAAVAACQPADAAFLILG